MREGEKQALLFFKGNYSFLWLLLFNSTVFSHIMSFLCNEENFDWLKYVENSPLISTKDKWYPILVFESLFKS
jgi:hypothetical protein